MIDLVDYYIKNVEESKNNYYLREFSVQNAMLLKLLLVDLDEVIEVWKTSVYPNAEDESNKKVFYLTSFYLFNEGYIIKEHPKLLKNINEPLLISNKVLRKATADKYGYNGSGGGVAWEDRRRYIDELSFIKKNKNIINISENIQDIINKVSGSNTTFIEMTEEEKLAEIINTVEYFMKENSKYIEIPFEDISFNFISKDDVKEYKKEMQCFRHGSKASLIEREMYTKEDKLFLIDYGLMVLKIINNYLKKNKDK